jgi:hypothetical protein
MAPRCGISTEKGCSHGRAKAQNNAHKVPATARYFKTGNAGYDECHKEKERKRSNDCANDDDPYVA